MPDLRKITKPIGRVYYISATFFHECFPTMKTWLSFGQMTTSLILSSLISILSYILISVISVHVLEQEMVLLWLMIYAVVFHLLSEKKYESIAKSLNYKEYPKALGFCIVLSAAILYYLLIFSITRLFPFK